MRQSLYIPGNRGLHRLNPLTKLVGTLCVFLVTFTSLGLWVPGGVLFLFILPMAVLSGLSRPLFRALTFTALILVIALFLIHGLFNPLNQTAAFGIGDLVFYREGLNYAALVSLRVLAALGGGLLFVFSTHPGHLMTVLDKKGVPAELTYILGSTLQIIPQIQARAGAIQAAQRARGLETEGNLVARSKALLPLLMPLLLGSLLDVEERAMALEARAFRSGHPKSSLVEIPDPVIESIGRWVMVVLSLGLVIVTRLL